MYKFKVGDKVRSRIVLLADGARGRGGLGEIEKRYYNNKTPIYKVCFMQLGNSFWCLEESDLEPEFTVKTLWD